MIRRVKPSRLTVVVALGMAALLPAQSRMDGYFSVLQQNRFIMPPKLRDELRRQEQRVQGAQQPAPPAGPAATPAANAAIAATTFRPVPEERARAVNELLANLPASLGREQQRARIEALGTVVENSLGGFKNNVAVAMYLVIGTSFHTATNLQVDAPRAAEYIRAVAQTFESNASFQRLGDRERSRIYYMCLSLVALQGGLSASPNPAEREAAKTLARAILSEMGLSL